MLPVAFAPSTWTATLRRIARTAVASLVLIAGFQGIAATPAHAAAASHATIAAHAVTTEHVAAIKHVAAVEHVATRQAVTTAATRSAELTAADAPTAALRTTGPGTGPAVTATPSADAAGPVPGVEVVAAAEPGRADIARRGPPRA
ncbi:hypothetical protein ACFWRG_00735 [Micromonospora tulbaghiae]|uniref:Uncharacterized protein n=1 Tax=Micromonospora tulbaghiae TaxID=479978 RepID=A0ABY0KG84_9ACTN|nr:MULTISPECIES: hypothetical protein [Micromonospora]KAB1908749.1 hypothetical protein F8279_06265 [Micromonospora sp. AMSO1212t]MDX5456452.1 hypothetical protein [Micromonospora tulbaghiae]SCE68336.1 hypothetical protein GA0070562_1680 [Micromonospora tulbaghiae]